MRIARDSAAKTLTRMSVQAFSTIVPRRESPTTQTVIVEVIGLLQRTLLSFNELFETDREIVEPWSESFPLQFSPSPCSRQQALCSLTQAVRTPTTVTPVASRTTATE